MEFFLIYLIVCIEKIASILVLGGPILIASVCFFLLSAFVTIIAGIENGQENALLNNPVFQKIKSWTKGIAVICAISYSIGSILPSQKEMAIIAAGGVTYNVITSDTSKRVGGKAIELLEKHIDNALSSDPELKDSDDKPSVIIENITSEDNSKSEKQEQKASKEGSAI